MSSSDFSFLVSAFTARDLKVASANALPLPSRVLLPTFLTPLTPGGGCGVPPYAPPLGYRPYDPDASEVLKDEEASAPGGGPGGGGGGRAVFADCVCRSCAPPTSGGGGYIECGDLGGEGYRERFVCGCAYADGGGGGGGGWPRPPWGTGAPRGIP